MNKEQLIDQLQGRIGTGVFRKNNSVDESTKLYWEGKISAFEEAISYAQALSCTKQQRIHDTVVGVQLSIFLLAAWNTSSIVLLIIAILIGVLQVNNILGKDQ